MVRWKEAAADNPILTAAELFFMAHPDERVPWRRFLSAPLPPPRKWGRRKPRSLKPATTTTAAKEAEEEKAPGRASPTTPLSWNPCEFGENRRETTAAKRPVAANGGGRGGGGSMKTATELKECERALLEKNMLLRKRLEDQRMTQQLLAKENKRLKSLESKLHQHVVTETNMTSAGAEETKHKERQCLPFDLNLPCSTDLDDEIIFFASCS